MPTGPLGGTQLLIFNYLNSNNIRANEDGSAPANAPEAWTIFWALRARVPALVGQAGYTALSPTFNRSGRAGCGIGFELNHLVKRNLVDKESAARVRPDPPTDEPGVADAHNVPPNAPNQSSRSVQVYYLYHNATLP